MAYTVRIWDLPTRLFHWILAACIVGLVVSGKMGGNAMIWHFRFGYLVGTLLLFRLVWGVIGGRWSRFSSFSYHPTLLVQYLRGKTNLQDTVGHNPLGVLSVFALLASLAAQVLTGLLSDDEIAFSGPLVSLVSNAVVNQATHYHQDIGQFLVLTLIALHILAIAFYVLIKKNTLVGPMVHGDKILPSSAQPSRDDGLTRTMALVVFGACAALVWWMTSLT